jgi:hypothetical protein
MFVEIDNPDPYMGISGPLVYVYEELFKLYLQPDLRECDQPRARAICEAWGFFEASPEDMQAIFQRSLFECMIDIEKRLANINTLKVEPPEQNWDSLDDEG